MRVALLTSDGRETFRRYSENAPLFGAAPAALIEGLSVLKDIEVHVISCYQEPPNGAPWMLAPNIYFHALHVPRLGWLRTGYQGCIRAVRKLLRKIDPDLAHGQGTERDCTICAVYSGLPNVVTIHGNMAELARMFAAKPFSYGWLTARLEDFCLPRTRGVFCNSSYTEDLVRPRAVKTWRVPNPLRQPFFDEPPGGRSDSPVIVNIGVVSPRKRQVEILELASRLNRERVICTFRFVGACDGSDDYQRQFLAGIETAQRAGYAQWLGTMGEIDIVRQLDSARAVLHFPLEEAFGLVVAEALARNVKFFGARTGGIIDISRDVESAELYEAQDWTGLEHGIRAWLEAGAPCPTTPRDLMRERYEPKVIARRHVEIYNEVLSSV